MSPQSLAEGPSFRLQPSHLGPTEEELPPPPDEPVGFPEREVSTGMGPGLGLLGGPQGWWELGQQGPPGSPQLPVQ